MRKSIDIRKQETIIKLDAIQFKLNLSTPKIIDMALDRLIESIIEQQQKDLIIHKFINRYNYEHDTPNV
jgi:hypothetical protein